MRLKVSVISMLEKLRVRDQIRLITVFSTVGLLISILILSLMGMTLKRYTLYQEQLLEAERQLVDARFDHSQLQAEMNDFIRRPSAIKADDFQHQIDRFRGDARELQLFDSSSKLEKSRVKLQTQLDLYQESFNLLWQNFQSLGVGLDQGLQKSLNTKGAVLKNILHEVSSQTLVLASLEVALLDLRHNEKKYFLTNKPLLLVEMKRLYDAFNQLLAASDLKDEDKQHITASVSDYYQVFVQASYVSADLQQAKLNIESSHELLANDFTHWMTTLRQDLYQAKQEIQKKIERFLTLLLCTAGIVGGLVFVSGRFVASTISRPITKVASSLQALSEGQSDSDIPYKSLNNEIGQIAKASEVFKESLFEAQQGAVAEAKRQVLEESNAQLESTVIKRTEQLATRNNELKEAMEKLEIAQDELLEREKLAALGALVAGVSHELNTPLGNTLTVLTSIGVEHQLIKAALSSGELTQGKLSSYLEYTDSGLNMAEKNLARANELVKHFKQVAVDQTSESRRYFNLKEVTEEVVQTLKPTYKHQDYSFNIDIPEIIFLDSYPGPYGQVISNLINNACLHGFDSQKSGVIQVSATVSESSAQVIIQDDGKGMPEKVLQRIFEPFYTTKLGQGGSGLGMNIVYNMVTGILGGKIKINSVEGEGTVVTLTLALKAPESNSSDKSMVFG